MDSNRSVVLPYIPLVCRDCVLGSELVTRDTVWEGEEVEMEALQRLAVQRASVSGPP